MLMTSHMGRCVSSVCISSLVVCLCLSSLQVNLSSGVNSFKEKSTSSIEIQVSETSPLENLEGSMRQETSRKSITLVHALDDKLKIKDMSRHTSKYNSFALHKLQWQNSDITIPFTGRSSSHIPSWTGIRDNCGSGNRRYSKLSFRSGHLVQPLVNLWSPSDRNILETGSILKQRNSRPKILQPMPHLESINNTELGKQPTPAGNGCGTSSTDSEQNEKEGILDQRLPLAIVIGVKKCGTRALLEFLRLHPDVRAAGPETHFFDRNYARGFDWYRRQMPLSTARQLTVEKTPSYFITKDAPQRIFNMSAKVRLIIVVRDPVTRAISDYVQAVSKRPRLPPFIDLAFRNASRSRLPVPGVKSSWAPIQLGIYSRHMKRWLIVFPRHQIHVVDGEQLIKNPFAEMAKVQDFLQLKPAIRTNHFYFSRSKGFPCFVVDSDGRSQERTSPSIRCLGRTKGRPHPQIDAHSLRQLREFYRPFNEDFFRMTGMRFYW